ncbi:HipA family kinase [Arhodomonas sp. SL1]|uniref:HipA family kinase n=1 Tax=Arhodomonas sp. SL1 TaxID=3425691 RepID=UPI003F882B50
MTVEIVEILRRSEQGVTKPFICRGEDGAIYFVKGRGAGRHSLIAEWLAGRFGQHMGLPIASFELVEVPHELVDAVGDTESQRELGAGLAFGSMEREVTELTYARVEEIAQQLRGEVLVFDWWIRNGDRMLSEAGGNPNLFWDEAQQSLVVIDHNDAFDRDVDPASFVAHHVFRSVVPALRDDAGLRDACLRKCRDALSLWDTVVAEIPQSWWYQDPEQTVPATFDVEAAQALLQECLADRFWPWER